MADETARAMAREWWHEQVDAGEEVDIKELASMAAAHFGADPQFCGMFTAEFLYPVMYDMGQRIVAQTRAVQQTREGLRAQVERDMADARNAGWLRSLQYDPGRRVHVPLANMDRAQVLASADYLAAQKEGIAFEERWLRHIARKLKGDAKVGDVFTESGLESLRISLQPTPTTLREAA